MKWLIVNGDDFGMSAGISRGIVEAHRFGILTSTSFMVHRPASEEAAALARNWPRLSVGLHLELTDSARAAEEIGEQLERFHDLVGAAPTHLDSHHDAHLADGVVPHVLAQAERIGVPVRGRSGVPRIKKFYGQWDGAAHPEQISVETFLRLIDAEAVDGVTELVCHPGRVEPGLGTSYAAEREIELATLCNEGLRRAILAREIRLIGFRDLPTPARRSPVEDSCPRS